MNVDASKTFAEHSPTRHLSQDREKPEVQLMELARQYVRENPDGVAIGCFSIGFVLGWKLKPW